MLHNYQTLSKLDKINLSAYFSILFKSFIQDIIHTSGQYGFGHIYWRNPQWSASLFVQWPSLVWDCQLPIKLIPHVKIIGTHRSLTTNVCFIALLLSSTLTLSWRRSISYKNQSIDLHSKSMDWFLYNRDYRHESVK